MGESPPDTPRLLGPVSIVDGIEYCLILLVQLFLQVKPWTVLWAVVKSLPFLCFRLPVDLAAEHLGRARRKEDDDSGTWRPTLREDVIIRCVRFALANLPTKVIRVFLSKGLMAPFVRRRLARHKYPEDWIYWYGSQHSEFKGLWVTRNPNRTPDICIYYIHGGGFCMGSPYFYLEFLISWVTCLTWAGYDNPAIFALEYTLAPEAIFPTQLNEALAGYKHVVKIARGARNVCVSGDSAGGGLAMALLLFLSRVYDIERERFNLVDTHLIPDGPRMAILISPWSTLISKTHCDAKFDYLDKTRLHQFARDYAGTRDPHDDLLSPGECQSGTAWRMSGVGVMWFIYGEKEMFARDIRSLIDRLLVMGLDVHAEVEEGGIHVWPVASVLVSETQERRFEGLGKIVGAMCQWMGGNEQ